MNHGKVLNLTKNVKIGETKLCETEFCEWFKMSEMQKVSEVFKSNLNYHHRVEHKKLL